MWKENKEYLRKALGREPSFFEISMSMQISPASVVEVDQYMMGKIKQPSAETMHNIKLQKGHHDTVLGWHEEMRVGYAVAGEQLKGSKVYITPDETPATPATPATPPKPPKPPKVGLESVRTNTNKLFNAGKGAVKTGSDILDTTGDYWANTWVGEKALEYSSGLSDYFDSKQQQQEQWQNKMSKVNLEELKAGKGGDNFYIYVYESIHGKNTAKQVGKEVQNIKRSLQSQ